jgi:hypothetical protein
MGVAGADQRMDTCLREDTRAVWDEENCDQVVNFVPPATNKRPGL